MAIELYFFQPLGTNSGRVFLALIEKGVPFIERELDGVAFEHLRPAYLAINPRGQVPALVHDGRPLTEGAPICEYIDEAFAGPALRPADLDERCTMRRWCRYLDVDLGRAVMMIHWNRIVPAFVGARSPEEVERIIASVPDPDRRRAWRRAYLQQTPPEELAESHRRIAAGAARIEQALARGPWLAGRSFSLADIDLLSFYAFLAKWSPEVVNELTTPRTLDWIARMEERPAVRELRARSRMPQRAPVSERGAVAARA
ncbi:MAG TPA: glutathione S-transferase family protein [Steroidobacteraceae bacterium]|nr:glutathione S-transferase family protein [Steroidobacteraceae bacterium]